MEENRNEMEMNLEATTNDYAEGEVYEDENGGLGSVLGCIAICAMGYVAGRIAVGGGKKLVNWGRNKAKSIKTKAEAKKFVDDEKVDATVVEDETK